MQQNCRTLTDGAGYQLGAAAAAGDRAAAGFLAGSLRSPKERVARAALSGLSAAGEDVAALLLGPMLAAATRQVTDPAAGKSRRLARRGLHVLGEAGGWSAVGLAAAAVNEARAGLAALSGGAAMPTAGQGAEEAAAAELRSGLLELVAVGVQARSPQHGLSSNKIALITSDCGTNAIPRHQMALITSECGPSRRLAASRSGWSVPPVHAANIIFPAGCWP